MITPYIIHGKTISVMASHNLAIVPWAEVATGHDNLGLITLDHHTDTRPAFTHDCYSAGSTRRAFRPCQADRLNRAHAGGLDAIDDVAHDLAHDEQIDAASALNILDHAFVISYEGSSDKPSSLEHRAYVEENFGHKAEARRLAGGGGGSVPAPPTGPFTYSRSENGLYEVGVGACLPGCEKYPHDDDCERAHYDAAIESSLLECRFRTADAMALAHGLPRAAEPPYGLDIDLDYFHTRRAVEPGDSRFFHELIRGAEAITIATEPEFVCDLALDDEARDANWLLERVFEHIDNALG